MIKVLLVDDSATSQLNIRQILDQDSEISVVASVFNGEEALDAARHGGIDVVVMDVSMPIMNGIDATRHIMANHPLPIVICSSAARDPQIMESALESGALSVLEKPPGPGHPERQKEATRLIQTVKQAAKTNVSRRPLMRSNNAQRSENSSNEIPEVVSSASAAKNRAARVANDADKTVEIVAIGASTGGPPVLQTLFQALTPDFPVPILVVQHIAEGFLPGLVAWMRLSIALPIHIASEGEIPRPGHIYFAPDDHHLGVDAAHHLTLSDAPPDAGLRPSVAWLFRCVARQYGAHSLGFLLSGMGRDGATELGLMRAAGAETWAQNKESSIVHGMPGEAIRLGAAAHIASPQQMAQRLITLTKNA